MRILVVNAGSSSLKLRVLDEHDELRFSEDLPALDLRAANALYLVPGIGAQGATPADVAATFAACPERVMPSASRSLLAAGPEVAALGEAAAALNARFREVLGGYR